MMSGFLDFQPSTRDVIFGANRFRKCCALYLYILHFNLKSSIPVYIFLALYLYFLKKNGIITLKELLVVGKT